MTPKRVLMHAVVAGYVLVTAGAFVFTMTKHQVPLPDGLLRWSYGMMAPYQGDTSWNAEFVYEGQLPDGSWETIDLDKYMPYMFAERNVRKFLRVYARLGPLGHRVKFGEYALLLLDRERARGKEYRAVRVFFDQWPRSPAGYSFLYLPPYTTRELITTVR